MIFKLVPSFLLYGTLVAAILYEWTWPYLIKGWIVLGCAVGLYLVYKLFRPGSAEDLHKRLVGKDNKNWSGDLESHRRRREAREAVHRREEMIDKAKKARKLAEAEAESKRGIEAFPAKHV